MCGICGFAGPPTGEDDAAVARAMSAAIAHRGPDGEDAAAFATGDRVAGAFGHRRLRILDLTDAAMQPMVGADGRTLLTYNGEIYNFRELRRELEAHGHAFRSSGDTEVVLRAYEQWGSSCVERLDGMFAFAVWDARGDRLLLARDRTGKKPLFYAAAGGRLTFASEVKALARAPWVTLEPDRAALPEFLTFGYVPWPATFYRGVLQVPPGTTAEFDVRAGTVRIRPYWTGLPQGPPVAPSAATDAEIRRLVEGAVARRLVADVPVGALLSGGIDSAVVTALMARAGAESVRTFSVGFPDEPTFDERPSARAVAKFLGTQHTEFTVRPDAVALLDRLIRLHDGPFADSSAIPTYLVAEAAREHVKVVLTGDGGDEVFAGYQRFTAAALSRAIPPSAARAARRVAARLPRGTAYHDTVTRLDRLLAASELPLEDGYQSTVAVFRPGDLGGAPDPGSTFGEQLDAASALPPIDRILYANLRTYLPDDLHAKVDRCTMAHGLEARSPMLDTALIAFAGRIRARHKVGLCHPKPLLRRAFAGMVPDAVWTTPKHGFGVPMDVWFAGPLGERYADEVLARDGRLTDWLPADGLRRLWQEHRGGGARHGPRLWTLLTLERWLRLVADEAL